MLDLIRKKQKSVIIKVVFWVIIAAFVGTIFLVWGRGRDQTGETQTAAVVNGEEIPYGAYQSSYDNLYRLYQNIYQDQFTPAMERQLNLKDQAMQALIEQVLLAQEAERQGVSVSRQEVVEAISRIPEFQENGSFSKQRYLSVLNYQRINPEDYEASKRRELRIEKLRRQIHQGISVSDEEIDEEFRRRNEKVDLRFLRFAPELFESRVEVDGEKIEAYFEENKEAFRLPERVAIAYLQFEPENYEDEVVLSDEDLEAYYRDHLDQFDIPEQVRASHILIKVPEDADEETRSEKKELAGKILDRIEKGEDFADLARRYSDDSASASEGGDLGLFQRGMMVGPFEEAAFNLPVGGVSDLVRTEFGYHIIKATEHIEAGVKPLTEVADQVKTAAQEEKAVELARDRAWEAYSRFKETGDLQAAADENNLGIKETGLFAREGVIDGLGRAPDISKAAFALKESQLGKPIDFKGDIYLFKLEERAPSRIPELADVEAEVKAAYRAEQAEKLAEQAARDALAGVREGSDLTDIDAPKGTEVENTGMFNRTGGAFIPRLGTSDQLAEDAFNLSEQSPVAPQVYEIGGNYVVAVLSEHRDADLANLDEVERTKIRETLLEQKKQDALTQKIEALRKEAEIKILVPLNRR